MACVQFPNMKDTIDNTTQKIDILQVKHVILLKDITTLHTDIVNITDNQQFRMLREIIDFFSNDKNKNSIQYTHDEKDENNCKYTVSDDLKTLLNTSNTLDMMKTIHVILSSILALATMFVDIASIIIEFVTEKIVSMNQSASIRTPSTRQPIRQAPQDGIRAAALDAYGKTTITTMVINRVPTLIDSYMLNPDATQIIINMALKTVNNM